MQGKIIKGIAGFYYVYVENKGIYECKAKGKFRNKSIKPLVGDNVMVDIIDEEKKNLLDYLFNGERIRCIVYIGMNMIIGEMYLLRRK